MTTTREDIDEAILDARDDGLQPTEIAPKLGVSIARVVEVLREHHEATQTAPARPLAAPERDPRARRCKRCGARIIDNPDDSRDPFNADSGLPHLETCSALTRDERWKLARRIKRRRFKRRDA